MNVWTLVIQVCLGPTVCVHVRVCTSVYMCVYVCVYMCVQVCICVCVHARVLHNQAP